MTPPYADGLLRLPVHSMFSAHGTMFLQFKPLRVVAAVLAGRIRPALAVRAGKRHDHSDISCQDNTPKSSASRVREAGCGGGLCPRRYYGPCYSIILLMTPAPTVWPPSRIANRRPSSIAIGTISSALMWTLSPGITISTPSGSSTEPVTSVVRK